MNGYQDQHVFVAYLFRGKALDFTFLERGNDTTFRAEVDDFWFRIPEVKS